MFYFDKLQIFNTLLHIHFIHIPQTSISILAHLVNHFVLIYHLSIYHLYLYISICFFLSQWKVSWRHDAPFPLDVSIYLSWKQGVMDWIVFSSSPTS